MQSSQSCHGKHFMLPFAYLLTISLLRMADFSSTWGPRSEQGGYKLSQIKSLYESPDME